MNEYEKQAKEFLMGLGDRARAEGDWAIANSYWAAGLRVGYNDAIEELDETIAAVEFPTMAMVTAHCWGRILECSRCRRIVTADWNFCPYCGAVFINERDPETGKMSDVPEGGAYGTFTRIEEDDGPMPEA